MINVALYQPDIPQNTGTILRMCACLGINAHIIQPAGFVLSDRSFKRAGMDYLDQVSVLIHDDWSAFQTWHESNGSRLVGLTTRSSENLYTFGFGEHDTLLFGRESAGLPEEVHEACDARLRIPIRPTVRSLNVAVAAAMAAGEAIRQLQSGAA